VAIGTGQDEGVQTLLAAAGALNPLFSERTGVHVATSLSIAALGETVLELLGPAGAEFLLNHVGGRVPGLPR
jgi:hypothetical protein